MKTSHRESETGHTAAILEEIPAMFCNGLRCLLKLKIARKTLITSQCVAGPLPALICDASRSSKWQENGPFHRIVWPGLYSQRLHSGSERPDDQNDCVVGLQAYA